MKRHGYTFMDDDSFECVKCGKSADFDTATTDKSECDESEVYPMCEHGKIDNQCSACMYAANE